MRRRKAPENRENVVHITPEPTAARLEQACAYARVCHVPLKLIVGEEMYQNWRRRVKRLERARITDPGRAAAIDKALRRLATGGN